MSWDADAQSPKRQRLDVGALKLSVEATTGTSVTFPEVPTERTIIVCEDAGRLSLKAMGELLGAGNQQTKRLQALHEVALERAAATPGEVYCLGPGGLSPAGDAHYFEGACTYCQRQGTCWSALWKGATTSFCRTCWQWADSWAFKDDIECIYAVAPKLQQQKRPYAALWPSGGAVLTVFGEEGRPAGNPLNVGVVCAISPDAWQSRLSGAEFLELVEALGQGVVSTVHALGLSTSSTDADPCVDTLIMGAIACDESSRPPEVSAEDVAASLLRGIRFAAAGNGAAVAIKLLDKDGVLQRAAAAMGTTGVASDAGPSGVASDSPSWPLQDKAPPGADDTGAAQAGADAGASSDAAPARESCVGPSKVRFLHDVNPTLWKAAKEALTPVAERGCTTSVALHALIQKVRKLVAEAAVEESLEALHGGLDTLWPAEQDYSAGRVVAVSRLMAACTIALPELFPEGLPVLRQGEDRAALLSRRQCLALLAGTIFGLVPKQDFTPSGEWGSLPSFDITGMLNGGFRGHSFDRVQLVLCMLNYIEELAGSQEETPDFLDTEFVSFARRMIDPELSVDDRQFWTTGAGAQQLGPFDVVEGTIEGDDGALQADFANRFIGGGVLAGGLAQEEIRFLICPECIAGCLFVEKMRDDEAIFIVGALQYSTYSGYWDDFRFTGSRGDLQRHEMDRHGRRDIHLVAFDAVSYSRREKSEQYEDYMVLREIQKAYAACLGDPLDTAESMRPFATGNWGSGAFKGDPQLKALIQWVAASAHGRPIRYYPFGDQRVQQLGEVVRRIQDSGADCARLFAALIGGQPRPECSTFDAVLERLGVTA